DAMPGKQMAIDSDLNAGLITEEEARTRRDEIRREADFFGAMDGSSKFVRGDTIAGIVILAVNILGGIAVGILERGWEIGQTVSVFTTLTIGDGLTSMLPSFIISIASALIVTRSGSKQGLGDELTGQLVSQPRGLIITAIFLGLLALTPLPTTPLIGTSLVLGLIAFGMGRVSRKRAEEVAAEQAADIPASAEPPPIENLLKVDTLELEVGYGLVGMVDKQSGGDLLDRISAIRRQLAVELGVVMPPVRIRDNMQLPTNEYRVKVRGAEVARGETRPGRVMAMDSGIATGNIEGEPTKEPAFGLDAWWIDPRLHQRAESMNYTVVDATSVLATHLTEIVRRNAGELLTREEVNNLIEGLKGKAPRLVEEAVPSVVKPADLQKVLQNLLRERVPVRDLETIVETMADWASKTQDLDVLTEYVRNALRRTICEQHATPGENGLPTLHCVTLDPAFEDQINAYVDRGASGTTITMPASVAARYAQPMLNAVSPLTSAGHAPVIVTSPQVRAAVFQLIEPQLPGVAVLGYNEVANGVEVETHGLVRSPDAPSGVAGTVGAA
ncbi:MAG: flagellar biosynthesis protein FlhA, partial [Planctomycetota bacterium]